MKTLSVFFCAMVIFFCTVNFANAYYAEYSGTFDHTGSTWTSPHLIDVIGLVIYPDEYHAYEFTSDLNGPHIIEIASSDMVGGPPIFPRAPLYPYTTPSPLVLYLYEDSFDSNNPYDNLVHDWLTEISACNGDAWAIPNSFTYPLTAGNSYVLVTGPFCGGTGDFTNIISPIPIPPAIWIFFSGLIGVLGFRRKLRKEA